MNTNPLLVLLRWSFCAPLDSFVAREMEGSSKGEGRGKAFVIKKEICWSVVTILLVYPRYIVAISKVAR